VFASAGAQRRSPTLDELLQSTLIPGCRHRFGRTIIEQVVPAEPVDTMISAEVVRRLGAHDNLDVANSVKEGQQQRAVPAVELDRVSMLNGGLTQVRRQVLRG
jgi:hypothetical protein